MHEVILDGTSNIFSSRVLTTYLVQTTMTDYFKTLPSISTQGTHNQRPFVRVRNTQTTEFRKLCLKFQELVGKFGSFRQKDCIKSNTSK